MSDPSSRRLIVYRDMLLPISETFILDQPESLPSYVPHYLGSRLVHTGMEPPRDRTVVVNDGSRRGRAAEIVFKASGRSLRLERTIRATGAPLVHAHFGPDATVVLPLARRMSLPLVCTFHGYDATVSHEGRDAVSATWRLYQRRFQALTSYTSLAIAVSGFIARAVADRGFREETVEVHYIGIDTEFFSPAPGPRDDVVLFVGRLVEKKGCAHLIEAMSEVQRTSDVELVIIGDGPLRTGLERLAAEKLRRVTFLGGQPRSVVKEWMNRARVFCVPSIVGADGDAEGFGLVFAEAQSMGTPVVSFRTGGVPEAVAHGETGFVETSGNEKALAQRIASLLEDDELWSRFSDAGRRRVRRDFDLVTQSAKLEKLYDERVTPPRARR